ncbi:MAG: cation diffusion facilitator family transporter [Cytophagaceae bacterium]|jgi:cation diffusion facilitator family transporter|nr:cation diffusion facilitator family transporter [Cytophagaceae bacterium]
MKSAEKTIYGSIAASLALVFIKGSAGYWGHSYALMADAIESCSDVFASLIVLLGIRISLLPRDDNHPYGHGRIEALATFAVVLLLIGSALFIAYESIQNIRTPHEIPHPFTLVVLAIIILVKELLYRLELKKSKETKSSSLEADAWHHRSDAITSLAAFIGISIALWFGPGYEVADDWAALFASVFILYNTYLIFRPAFGELMDEHTHHDLISEIRTIASRTPGVLDTEKCFVRKTGMRFYVDLHVIVHAQLSVAEGHFISHCVKDSIILDRPEVADVLVHIEPDQHLHASPKR